MLFSPSTVVIASLLFANQISAFWRLPCGAPVIVERADPIVSSGKVAGHLHTISGGSNIALNSTFATMRASECTSCLVKQDLSAYWSPALFFQWANGSFTSVEQVGGGLIYYLPRNNSADTGPVLAFPDGLRMLIGSPFLRSYNESDLMSQAIGWNCLGQAANPTRNPFLPPNDCPDGLRGELRFPSCWDGINIDSSDHISHMAYSDGESGPCPASQPNRIVTLFYEMMWSVNPFAGMRAQGLNATQPFVLAMGDPTGFGYHADFLDGWDKTVLQEAINTCTSASGVIQECPLFDLHDSTSTCAKTPDVDEVVTGTLTALPGCNPVSSGPATVTPCTAATTPAIFQNPVAYTGGAPPPGSQVVANAPSVVTLYKTWAYQDCYSDNVGGVRALPNGLATSPQTVATCLDACSAAGFVLCGIEYHGECWGGNVLGNQSTAIGYGQCSFTCNGNALEYCGGSNSFDLYERPLTVSSSSSIASSTTSKLSSAFSLTSKVSSSTTSTTAPAATSSVAGKVATNARWAYSSCMSDLVNNARSLPNMLSSNQTVDGCLAACDAGSYAVCGLSYYGECYGGFSISNSSTVLPASSCTYACTNNPKETCGGSGSLDVYLSTVVKALTTPTTPNLASSGGWTYSACYSDASSIRALPLGLSTSNVTIESCLAACTASGAKVCGLEYYGECWSSKTAIANTSSILAPMACQFPCRGNSLEWCGGSSALSVYIPAKVAKRGRRPIRW